MNPEPCAGCGAEPGVRHRWWCPSLWWFRLTHPRTWLFPVTSYRHDRYRRKLTREAMRHQGFRPKHSPRFPFRIVGWKHPLGIAQCSRCVHDVPDDCRAGAKVSRDSSWKSCAKYRMACPRRLTRLQWPLVCVFGSGPIVRWNLRKRAGYDRKSLT